MPANSSEKFSGRTLTFTSETLYQGWVATRIWTCANAFNESDAFDAVPIPGGGDAIPQKGDEHPQSSILRADTFKADQISIGFWTVTVNYKWWDTGFTYVDPLLQPPKLRWGVETVSVPVERDQNNNPIVNSAGQPFSTPAMDDVTYLTLRISRNEPYFDPKKSITSANKTNSDNWTLPSGAVIPMGQALCRSVTCPVDLDISSTFAPVVYMFAFRPSPNGWKLRVKDKGSQSWYLPDLNTQVPLVGPLYYQKGFNQVTDEVELDGTGQYLNDYYTNKPGTLTTSHANPTATLADTVETYPTGVFLLWKIKGSIPFNPLI